MPLRRGDDAEKMATGSPQPVAAPSREIPKLTQRANWAEVPFAFWLDPICKKFRLYGTVRLAFCSGGMARLRASRMPPGATRGLPPTCPRMASPALTGPRPGNRSDLRLPIRRALAAPPGVAECKSE